MSRQTKAQQTERQQAIAQLREWLKPGDTVYTILDHVSTSGMSRAIRVVVPYTREGGTIDHLHPNYAIGKALDLRHWKRNGYEQDALVIGGCGMDMGFHLVYELSSVLYSRRYCSKCKRQIPYDYPTDVTCGECDGEIEGGYKCLGKGKCPSNYHVNHRDFIRCEGTRVYNPDGPDHGSFCHKPDRYLFRDRSEVPPDWPMLPEIAIGDGQTVPRGYAACITDENGEHPQICPMCKGAGQLPNPDGPERWDLVHTDGYALRHRWL